MEQYKVCEIASAVAEEILGVNEIDGLPVSAEFVSLEADGPPWLRGGRWRLDAGGAGQLGGGVGIGLRPRACLVSLVRLIKLVMSSPFAPGRSQSAPHAGSRWRALRRRSKSLREIRV